MELVALQFLLYAAGWWLCGLLLHEQRAAALHWGAFMLFEGGGFALTGLRTDPRTWWAYVGSGLLFVSGFVAARRGLELFVGGRPRDRENLAAWFLASALLVAFGPGAEHAAWRVVVCYGFGAYLAIRMTTSLVRPLSQEFGARLTALLTLPALLLCLISVAQLARQLASLDVPLELHAVAAGRRPALIGYLIGAAMFNFSFMGMLVLRLVMNLRRQSMVDPLTGLFNRRALQARIAREQRRMRRDEGVFAMLALDLDHFKHVNDAHGHPVGDMVLVQTAQRMLQAARPSDMVARTGGEEFMLLVPQATAADARAIAERLRRCIEDRPFVIEGVPRPLALTVSIGVTLATSAEADVRLLLQRVDRALYRAKSEGRNRVVVDLAQPAPGDDTPPGPPGRAAAGMPGTQ